MDQPRHRGAPPLTDDVRRLDPRMRVVWRVQLGITAVVVVAAATVGALIVEAPLFLAALVAVVMAVVAWWLPQLWWEHWSFVLAATTLELRYGVLWRSEASVPYFRVQHVEIEQGPIERRLGLASLRLKTAATNGGATLPGVARRDADDLRRTILERAGGGDAV